MPERLSGQDRKLGRLGVLSEIGARNAQSAAAQQGQLMQQLAQMYQLSSQAEQDPVKLEQMRLQNAAMPGQMEAQSLANKGEQFKQAWAQPMAEQQYNLQGAQMQALQQRGSPQSQAIEMADMYARTTGAIPPWLEQMLMPPEVRAQREAEAAAKVQMQQAEQQRIAQQQQQQQAQAAIPTPLNWYGGQPIMPNEAGIAANQAANQADPLNPVNLLPMLMEFFTKNAAPVASPMMPRPF